MKVLVCGSTVWDDEDKIRERLERIPTDAIVIHGAARGADTIAGEVALDRGMEVWEFPANWKKYGKRAGAIRNIQMVEQEPDLVIAFWDGKSHGTFHTMYESVVRGIPVEVVHP